MADDKRPPSGIVRLPADLPKLMRPILQMIQRSPVPESAAVRALRGHVSDAELCAAQHAHEYMLAHEGPNGQVPDYL